MKTKAFILLAVYLAIGIATTFQYIPVLPWLIALAFVCYLLGMYFLILAKKENGFPDYNSPIPPKNKCICNDIEKQSPGGRCPVKHDIKK